MPLILNSARKFSWNSIFKNFLRFLWWQTLIGNFLSLGKLIGRLIQKLLHEFVDFEFCFGGQFNKTLWIFKLGQLKCPCQQLNYILIITEWENLISFNALKKVQINWAEEPILPIFSKIYSYIEIISILLDSSIITEVSRLILKFASMPPTWPDFRQEKSRYQKDLLLEIKKCSLTDFDSTRRRDCQDCDPIGTSCPWLLSNVTVIGQTNNEYPTSSTFESLDYQLRLMTFEVIWFGRECRLVA